MHLSLHRMTETGNSTLGELYLDEVFECYTLEDVVRDEKVPGETAIPTGTYKVVINWSPKFQKMMPRLLDVPNFTGILIHKGNTHHDTRGCILVGDRIGDQILAQSTAAYERLFAKIAEAQARDEEITIAITNNF